MSEAIIYNPPRFCKVRQFAADSGMQGDTILFSKCYGAVETVGKKNLKAYLIEHPNGNNAAFLIGISYSSTFSDNERKIIQQIEGRHGWFSWIDQIDFWLSQEEERICIVWDLKKELNPDIGFYHAKDIKG